MSTTIDHDAMAQFAAEKLGVEIKWYPGANKFYVISSLLRPMDKFEPWSSGDLMVKGIDALLSEHRCWSFYVNSDEAELYNYETHNREVIERTDGISIPTTFWTCWMRLQEKIDD